VNQVSGTPQPLGLRAPDAASVCDTTSQVLFRISPSSANLRARGAAAQASEQQGCGSWAAVRSWLYARARQVTTHRIRLGTGLPCRISGCRPAAPAAAPAVAQSASAAAAKTHLACVPSTEGRGAMLCFNESASLNAASPEFAPLLPRAFRHKPSAALPLRRRLLMCAGVYGECQMWLKTRNDAEAVPRTSQEPGRHSKERFYCLVDTHFTPPFGRSYTA
jgi:hypothetical protein